MVISLFCTSENGILIQDNFPMPSYFQRMMGVEVPYYYFTLKVKTNDTSNMFVDKLLVKHINEEE